MGARSRFTVVLAAVSVLMLPAAAHAQQVTGLEVRQDDGFATLSWDPVAGATDYQIERSGVVVGLWRPNRQVRQENPTFADAGFSPGGRFQWRVRARVSGVEQPFSTPCERGPPPPWGDPAVPGQNLRTGWETTQGAVFTTDTDEYAYTAAIDALSDRVRVVEIGRTVLGRPINMFVIGYPAPPAGAEAVAATYPLPINCNVHGNEPSTARRASSWRASWRSPPTPAPSICSHTRRCCWCRAINGDGRAANTRGNSTGQDLNRDYSLVRQPETFAFVRMLRDYRPVASYDGHEFGNSQRRRPADAAAAPPERGSVHLRPVAGHDCEPHVCSVVRSTAGGRALTAAPTAATSGSARRPSCATPSA